MKKTSWKTSLGGWLASIGTLLSAIAPATGVPFLLPIGVGLASLGQLITGLNARDDKLTSEAVGATNAPQASKTP